MGWFDEQIRQRKELDDDVFSDSFASIASAVMGRKMSAAMNDDRIKTKDEVDRILKFYHVKTRDVPDEIKDMNEQLEYLMRPYGFMRRTVILDEGWYRDSIGALLGKMKDSDTAVALIPNHLYGYYFYDETTGKKVNLNKNTEQLIDTEAIYFYKPLPLKKIGISDLLKYIWQTLSVSDIVMFALAALAVTLTGMFLPKLNKLIFSSVLESGSQQLLMAITCFIVCVSVSSLLFTAVKSLLLARITIKMNISVQAATMMRLMSLPADFFKAYSSGELSSRSQNINTLCSMLVNTVLSCGITSLFSLIYISQIFTYAPALAVPAVVIIVVTLIFSVISIFAQMAITEKQMAVSAKESGMGYALISGVQKIKLSGSEKRAFARWGTLFAQESELLYNPPLFLKVNDVINSGITMVGSIFLYYAAIKSHVSVSDYYAFNTAYAMVSAAFLMLSGVATTAAQIKPVMDMAKPILNSVPEVSDGKQVITKLSGGIELSHVSFRYTENMPQVVDDISLKIKPGQYVAIVGSTGCGKSTLMRIMLGFETPQKGAVYFDGKDLNKIDLKSLRRRIGIVMQNGKLFQGDIFSNITISAPWLTLEEAWQAAELSGIAEDIRRMPMGMNTMVSEGGGGISGGQKQRLMIARAIAPKPKILMFDEATSALDNVTQKKVSASLDALKCTRLVIAHRLSTIRQCDRIIVLDKGKIIEDGTYEHLINDGGFFSELVARQRLDDTQYVGKTTVY